MQPCVVKQVFKCVEKSACHDSAKDGCLVCCVIVQTRYSTSTRIWTTTTPLSLPQELETPSYIPQSVLRHLTSSTWYRLSQADTTQNSQIDSLGWGLSQIPKIYSKLKYLSYDLLTEFQDNLFGTIWIAPSTFTASHLKQQTSTIEHTDGYL